MIRIEGLRKSYGRFEAICDRVAIINEGRIATQGTVQELKELHTSGGGNLEDVFLKLIGSPDDREVIQVLREDRGAQV